MNFVEVATKIIKNSIISTVYVDDNIVEPFEAEDEKNTSHYNVSKGLYQSFRQENKSIDFYRFSKLREWSLDYEYILKNRDLLVLDWHLDDPTSLRQPLTLQILRRAILTDNLHFVSIYTNAKAEEFTEIFYSIKAHFESGYHQDIKVESELAFGEIEEKIDIDAISFFKSLAGELKTISVDPAKRDEVYDSTKETIMATLGKDAYPIFARFIKKISPFGDLKKGCEIFGYFINEEDVGINTSGTCLIKDSFLGNNFIVINHTIIQITNKNDPNPVNHFNFFTTALIEVCGNLLTLASLEIRNLLRESSGFIGKDADNINEAVLFHHYDLKKTSFFDFIIDILKSHTTSTLNNKISSLISLNSEFWEEYKVSKSIAEKLINLRQNQQLFHTEIAKLNVHYNQLHIHKKPNDVIKFGEIFMGFNEQDKPTGQFWLNVTAHCDCLRPKEKIKNNFYFILGTSPVDLETYTKQGDSGFLSFLLINTQPKVIKWNEGCVILKIENNSLNDFVITTVDGLNAKYKLKYLATLKENYAQRMANNSFAFAMRVGIDFASIG